MQTLRRRFASFVIIKLLIALTAKAQSLHAHLVNQDISYKEASAFKNVKMENMKMQMELAKTAVHYVKLVALMQQNAFHAFLGKF